MEKKTLAEIMAEPATVEAIIKKAMEINELLLKVENMPEVEETSREEEIDGYHTIPSADCIGCAFKEQEFFKMCSSVNCSAVFRKDNTDVIFVKNEEEVSSFNDVE